MRQTTRRKPTFQELRLLHQIPIQQIADQAQVAFKEVYLMELGKAVNRGFACKVLHALSLLAGHYFWLEQVAMPCETVDLRDAHACKRGLVIWQNG